MDRTYHHELWATDGTVEGTRELLRESEPDFAAYALTAWNDDLVFASSVANQTFLYSTDGTAIGTRQLATLSGVDQIVSADDGTLYVVRVFANFANMSSDWSGTHTFEVFHPPVAVNPIASETADATPVIAWASLTGAATYEVIVTRSLSQVPVYLRSGITGTAHRVSVAIANGIYLIQVRAIFADGSRSALSNAQRVTIGSPPELAFSSGEVTWNAVNQATHFELWLNRIGTAPKAKVVHTPVYVGTSFVPPASLPKGRYQIWLRAIRAEAGESYFGSWAALEFDHL